MVYVGIQPLLDWNSPRSTIGGGRRGGKWKTVSQPRVYYAADAAVAAVLARAARYSCPYTERGIVSENRITARRLLIMWWLTPGPRWPAIGYAGTGYVRAPECAGICFTNENASQASTLGSSVCHPSRGTGPLIRVQIFDLLEIKEPEAEW